MYKNRKYRGGVNATQSKQTQKTTQKVPLQPIDENVSIKLPERRSSVTKEQDAAADLFADADPNDSEGFIQPSQEHQSQRLLTQRSVLYKTQSSSKLTQRPPNNYFELVLMNSGADLGDGPCIVISCDHVTFVNKMRAILEKNPGSEENKKRFKIGLKEALENDELCTKLLSGCTIHIAEHEKNYPTQESMFMNFLLIDFLQQDVIKTLLDKIKVITKDENVQVTLLPLMISQFKYVTSYHGEMLYNEFMEIFEGANPQSQSQIVSCAEFFLSLKKHDEFIQFLVNNKARNKDLFKPSTVQMMMNLCLDAKVQSKLRRKVFQYIGKDCPVEQLPLLVKFLLKSVNSLEEEALKELIGNIRDGIVFKGIQGEKEKITQSQKDVYRTIKNTLISSKKFFDIWQKIIQTTISYDFKPMDFIVLVFMMDIKEEKSNYLENVIRKRIKMEQLNHDIISKTKEEIHPILQQEINNIFLLLNDFLKDKSPLISQFGREAYKLLFNIDDESQKKIINKLVELTCDKTSMEVVTGALEVIRDLSFRFPKELHNRGNLLVPMLDRIHEMNLNQSRMIMELICSIAYRVDTFNNDGADCRMLQEQIEMVVRKQIISRNFLIKNQGIIAAVQIIKYVSQIDVNSANEEIDRNQSSDASLRLEDIATERGRMAAENVNLICASTMQCPESRALFYDELAAALALKSNNDVTIDPTFLMWLSELTTQFFTTCYTSDEGTEEELLSQLRLSYQNRLNSDSDLQECPLALSIGANVLSPTEDKGIHTPLLLSSMFYLIRVVKFLEDKGSLVSINALLGCSLALPKIFETADESIEIFQDYTFDEAKKYLDIYFYYANWLRELISAFSTQEDRGTKEKVLKRLTELIKLEKHIKLILMKTPVQYHPPICDFRVEAKVNKVAAKPQPQPKNKKKPTKRKATETEVDENMTILGTMNPTQKAGNSSKILHSSKSKASFNEFDIIYGPKEQYRQLGPDIMLLLLEPFEPVCRLEKDVIGNCIGLLEFKFIMTDLVHKIESITGTKKFTGELSLQQITYPNQFITDIVKGFLRRIMKNFYNISSTIEMTLAKINNTLGNADLYSQEKNNLKVTFGLCLRFFGSLFSWTGFIDNEELLKEALDESLYASQNKTKTIEDMAKEIFEKFVNMECAVLDLKSAVHLVHLLVVLQKRFGFQNMEKDIQTTTKILIKRKWFSYSGAIEKGSTCNFYLNELFITYFKRIEPEELNKLSKDVLEDMKYLNKSTDTLTLFPNIHKLNFPMLLRALCDNLIKTTTSKLSPANSSKVESLLHWELCCDTLSTILDIVKTVVITRNFFLFVKYAHSFIKIFLQSGMTTFEMAMRSDPERVNGLLKKLQTTTKFLHRLCCQSKINNTAIVALIPMLRETVTALLYKVKAAMAANRVSDVFSVNVLKNRDIYGDDVIFSAISRLPSDEDQSANEEEHLPDLEEEIPDIPDDVSVDETVRSEAEAESSDKETEPPAKKKRKLRRPSKSFVCH